MAEVCQDRKVLGVDRVRSLVEEISHVPLVHEQSHLGLADDQPGSLLDLEIGRREPPREHVVAALGPLQDVDELLLCEAQDTHGRLRWLVRDLSGPRKRARPGGHRGNRRARDGLNLVRCLTTAPRPDCPELFAPYATARPSVNRGHYTLRALGRVPPRREKSDPPLSILSRQVALIRTGAPLTRRPLRVIRFGPIPAGSCHVGVSTGGGRAPSDASARRDREWMSGPFGNRS